MVKEKTPNSSQTLLKEEGLTTLDTQTMRGLVEAIRRIEGPDWTDKLDSGHLTIIDAGIVHDMLSQIQDKELVNNCGEHLTTLAREDIREILKRIQDSEAPTQDEIKWSRKVAARSYAQVLFNSALDAKQSDGVLCDLDKAVRLSQSADALAFLQDPEVRFEDKTKFLEDELGNAQSLVMKLTYDLLSKKKLDLLVHILDEYRRLAWGHDFVVRAEITTAIPLDEDDTERIGERLGQLIGRKVMLEPKVDPSIVGGFVLKVGSQKIDASLRRKLATLRHDLRRRIFYPK